MNRIKWLIIVLLFFSCNPEAKEKSVLDGKDILNKSIEYHDPHHHWADAEISIHIQEPRLNNPYRYSTVKLNLTNGNFELTRNREDHISKHTIDKEGHSKVYLNDEENIEEKFVEKYKLDPKRNFGYRDFYEKFIGLPMTLTDSVIKSIGNAESATFNGSDCYMVPLILNKPIFSEHWNVYIKKSTFEYKGMEIVFPNDSIKGERLIFEGEININKMKIPRIRHWYEFHDNSYSGSDIIIKELDKSHGG